MTAKIIRYIWSKFSSSLKAIKYRLYLWNIGEDMLKLGKGVYLAYGSPIYSKTVIGDYTRINGKITIKGGKQPVTIGKYCAFGSDIKIITANHITCLPAIQVRFYTRYFSEDEGNFMLDKGTLVIGNDVWIGDSVIILPGVQVGDGAVVGAGSVVTKNVPPYTIVGGVPAKKIKDRFSDRIKEQLLQIKWWDWPEEKIKANREFFMMDLEKVDNIDFSKVIR